GKAAVVTAQVFLASFDVEDWFHAENLRASLAGAAWSSLEARVERNTHEVLDILAGTGAKATFFVLGWIARRHPQVVRRIVAEGHEVASHSDVHARLDGLSRNALARDLAEARDSLEQITNLPVWGLRAPNFSIGDAVLDCLAEAGYWYDSSFYQFKAHDRYGRLAMPRLLKRRAYGGRGRMRRDLRRLLTEFGSARIDETLRSRGYAPPRAVAGVRALA